MKDDGYLEWFVFSDGLGLEALYSCEAWDGGT